MSYAAYNMVIYLLLLCYDYVSWFEFKFIKKCKTEFRFIFRKDNALKQLWDSLSVPHSTFLNSYLSSNFSQMYEPIFRGSSE